MSFVKALWRAHGGLLTAREHASISTGIVPLMQAIEDFKSCLRELGVRQTDLEIERLEEFQKYYSSYLDKIDFHQSGKLEVYREEIVRRMDGIFNDIYNRKMGDGGLGDKNAIPRVGGRFVNSEISGISHEVALFSDGCSTLLGYVKSDNRLGSDGRILDEIKRAQLIAMLEAMLVELKAPCVDRNKISDVGSWLSSLSKKIREDGTSKIVAVSLDGCVELCKRIGVSIRDAVGVDFPF